MKHSSNYVEANSPHTAPTQIVSLVRFLAHVAARQDFADQRSPAEKEACDA